MATMLSDPRLLTEDYRTEDLFAFDTFANDLAGKTTAAPNKSLLGIVGGYGLGKSTLLQKVRQSMEGDFIWVHFDAWKYPERTNLWEGFVLDFVRQVAPSEFDQVLKIMDGTAGDLKKRVIGLGGALTNLSFPGSGAVVNKLADFFVTSPAKRVFQIQEVLTSVLDKKAIREKQIYIVIEDADRSGDAGIYFVETLSHFLREATFKNRIKVFVPIAKQSFADKRDAYIKALDFVEFFEIRSRDFGNFVEKVFSPTLTSDEASKNHITEWLQRLFTNHSLSFRDLKFIIRNSESRYQSLQTKGHNPDPRIVLLLESARYIQSSSGQVLLDEIRREGAVRSGSSDIHLILVSIGQNQKVSNIAGTINGVTSRDNIFRNEISFINHSMITDVDYVPHPLQRGNSYILPDYYIA